MLMVECCASKRRPRPPSQSHRRAVSPVMHHPWPGDGAEEPVAGQQDAAVAPRLRVVAEASALAVRHLHEHALGVGFRTVPRPVLLDSTNGAKKRSNSSGECFRMLRMVCLGTDRTGSGNRSVTACGWSYAPPVQYSLTLAIA